MLKKCILAFLITLSVTAWAQPRPLIVPQTTCEYAAYTLAGIINLAEAQKSSPERLSQYQQLLHNPQYRDFQIPKLLAVGTQARLDGSDWMDAYGQMRFACNNFARGN